jgi:hypothetical protein
MLCWVISCRRCGRAVRQGGRRCAMGMLGDGKWTKRGIIADAFLALLAGKATPKKTPEDDITPPGWAEWDSAVRDAWVAAQRARIRLGAPTKAEATAGDIESETLTRLLCPNAPENRRFTAATRRWYGILERAEQTGRARQVTDPMPRLANGGIGGPIDLIEFYLDAADSNLSKANF